MDKTVREQRKTLKMYAEIFEHWHNGQLPHKISNTCIELERLDQTQNKDIWERLENAIKTNKELLDEDMLNTITDTDNEVKYWWYKMFYKMRDRGK